MNAQKKVQQITKRVFTAAGKEACNGTLQGIYLERYKNAAHDYVASITATDGHMLLSYYFTAEEYCYFERFVLPHWFNNGVGILFNSPDKAEHNKDIKYPQYRKALLASGCIG